jgi:fatty-acyl-CoA synthase
MKDFSSRQIDCELLPTPHETPGLRKRFSDFSSLPEALDYAAQGLAGVNFYSSRGDLEEVYTYAEIKTYAEKIGRYLIGCGARPGDRIGIVADMTIEFIATFFACQYAGLLAVPLPVVTGLGGRQGYEAQLERVIKTSGARLVIGPEKLRESLTKASSGKDLLLVGTLGDLYQSPSSIAPLQPLGPNDSSHIQYSSGSTRNPLGIMISQKALMANALSVARDGLKFRENDRVASWLPFYHDMGLIGFLLIPVTSQLSIDLIHTDGFARRPLKWLEVISQNRCTLAFSPTFGYEICTRRADGKDDLPIDLSCWRAAGIGGEMVQPSVMDNFSKAFEKYGFKKEAFVPSYGLAEMTLAFSFSPLDRGVLVDRVEKASLNDHRKAVPAAENEHAENIRDFAVCGVPMPGYGVQIRDVDTGSALPDRAVGQVFINGPAMMSGYYQDPQSTQAVMSGDGWLNTGDMGYMIDGMLVITGRQKDLIIINGRNIWPQDLEWHAEEHVESLHNRDTAAFSVLENGIHEKAVILAHCRSRDPAIQAALRRDIQAAVFTNAGIDCKIVLIPPGSLPYTTSGKLSRARAKQDYLSGVLKDVAEADGVLEIA